MCVHYCFQSDLPPLADSEKHLCFLARRKRLVNRVRQQSLSVTMKKIQDLVPQPRLHQLRTATRRREMLITDQANVGVPLRL
jgi:hypothetical protein